MRLAFIERLLGGLDDVGGRGEIGLANFQMDDVLALRAPALARAPALQMRTPLRCGSFARLVSCDSPEVRNAIARFDLLDAIVDRHAITEDAARDARAIVEA